MAKEAEEQRGNTHTQHPPIPELLNQQGKGTGAVNTFEHCISEINCPHYNLPSSKWQKPDKKLADCKNWAAYGGLPQWLGGNPSTGQRVEASSEILGESERVVYSRC